MSQFKSTDSGGIMLKGTWNGMAHLPRLRDFNFYASPQRQQLPLLRKVQRLRLDQRNLLKAEGLTRPGLRQNREIGRNYLGNPRIAASGLVVGHQYDGLPARGHLHGAKRDGARQQLALSVSHQLGPAEPVAHAVGLRGYGERLLPEIALAV
jgi:hypothetical protein